MSSLCLQMALHFHLYLIPFIVFCQIGCFYLKFTYIYPTYRVILFAFHFISIIDSLILPFFGYYGNLSEKIPALLGFWIINVILQAPIYLFFIIYNEIMPLPLERFIYGISLTFIIIEIFFVTKLIRHLSKYQTEKFCNNVLQSNDKTLVTTLNTTENGNNEKKIQ